MMSVYVLVFIHDKGLVVVAHLFDILLCDGRELLIGDFIIGMRVQGNMNNGLLRANLARHICQKVLHTSSNIVCAIGRTKHFVGLQNFRDTLVYLFSIVCQRPEKGASIAYFCDHFS